MSFVSSDIIGGLGNQLFILANLFAYAKRFGKYFIINSQQSVAPSCTFRRTYWFSAIMQKLLSHENCIDIGTQDGIEKFTNLEKNNSMQSYDESSFLYSEIPFFAQNLHLGGYYQSERYFEDCSAEIFSLLSLDRTDARFLKNKDTVSIHVRRGDYLKLSKTHPFLSTEYYQEAVRTHFSECKRFIIFSDDKEWVKQNLFYFGIPELSECQVCEIDDEIEVFNEMQSCGGGHIIANSSFSWWAAYLGCGFLNTAKVVAPLGWFGSEGPEKFQSIYVKTWILIYLFFKQHFKHHYVF